MCLTLPPPRPDALLPVPLAMLLASSPSLLDRGTPSYAWTLALAALRELVCCRRQGQQNRKKRERETTVRLLQFCAVEKN
jgi:hypothetical protein